MRFFEFCFPVKRTQHSTNIRNLIPEIPKTKKVCEKKTWRTSFGMKSWKSGPGDRCSSFVCGEARARVRWWCACVRCTVGRNRNVLWQIYHDLSDYVVKDSWQRISLIHCSHTRNAAYIDDIERMCTCLSHTPSLFAWVRMSTYAWACVYIRTELRNIICMI